MGVKYTKGIKVPGMSFYNMPSEHERQSQQQAQLDEEEEVYNDPPPPRRLRGSGNITSEETETYEAPHTNIFTALSKREHKSIKPEKVSVRLTTDIRKDLHTRLRIHSIRTDMSFIQIIEGWIEDNCPE